MTQDLANKIILCISYTDQFQYPLSSEDIYLRLIRVADDINLKQVQSELSLLVSKKIIAHSQGFYFLKENKSFIDKRLKRELYSKKKWLEAKSFVKIVKKLPWIMGIVVTGSLAVNNAKKDDDIDFMVITKKNRLWIVRVLLIIFAIYKGKRRSWNREEKNSWCLNLWLDDQSLKLPKRLKNIYGAFEVCQSVWLYSKDNTKQKFFHLNKWAKKFLPNYYIYQKNNKVEPGTTIRSLKFIDLFFDIANFLLFIFQYLYMSSHMTREKVKLNYAFFHPRDTRKQIMNNWSKAINKILISKSKNQAISASKLPESTESVLSESKNKSKTIVLVTGVFDVLHFEHLKFLKKAKKLGDVLIVALESDSRVKKIKGITRPLNKQEDRMLNLMSLNLADSIFILPNNFSKTENHIELIKKITPNILAVSSNTAHIDKKREIMNLVGGKLAIVHMHNPEISSTKIINDKIKELSNIA